MVKYRDGTILRCARDTASFREAGAQSRMAVLVVPAFFYDLLGVGGSIE
jgi:hypothetical protein